MAEFRSYVAGGVAAFAGGIFLNWRGFDLFDTVWIAGCFGLFVFLMVDPIKYDYDEPKVTK